MDSKQGNSSSKHKPEAIADEGDEQDLRKLENKSETDTESSSSSSSSSDSSSEEDFFQLDASEFSKQMTGNGEMPSSNPKLPQHGEDSQLISDVRIQSSEVASINLMKREEEQSRRVFSPDTSGDNSPDFSDNFRTLGAKQSPPIQVMARSDFPDPNRIPSSVFERTKSTTPMEWSVASNESLFSIHMGNSSFSRDHVFLLGRSGDLTTFSNSLFDGYPPLSPAAGSSPLNVDVGQELEQPSVAEATNAEAMKDVLRAAADELADKDEPPPEGVHFSGSASRHSDGSATSFAFPILTGEGRSGSMKVEPEHRTSQKGKLQQPPSQKETPKAVHSAAQSKWFPCLSCCLFCR